MSEHSLELKGSLFPLSVLHCSDLSISSLQSLLTAKLAQAPAFFYQAPIVINLQDNDSSPDFAALKQLFIELKLVLVGVTGANAAQKAAAQQAGLAVLQAGKSHTAKVVEPAPQSAAPERSAPAQVVVQQAMDSKIVEQNVRSGQQIYAKGADLIIKGAVGAGAEVIADGNIHIYGSLRGKAIAGASGDSSKRIYCYNMQAELVSIAGNYWLSHSLQGEFWGKPACIRWQGESLVISELV
jgi:septum site-determining protein MinC